MDYGRVILTYEKGNLKLDNSSILMRRSEALPIVRRSGLFLSLASYTPGFLLGIVEARLKGGLWFMRAGELF